MMRKIHIILIFQSIVAVYSFSQNFKEVYNFEINDMFQYYSYGNIFGGEAGLFSHIYEKYKIMNKIVNGDSVIYEITGKKLRHDFIGEECKWQPPSCQPHNWYYVEEINSQLIYVDSENHYLNRPVGSLTLFTWCEIYCDTVLTRIFTENIDNTVRKVVGGKIWDFDSNIYLYSDDTTSLDTINRNHWYRDIINFPDIYILKFSDGLGVVEHEEQHFEYWFIKTLDGYVKNGDTTGAVWSDEFFTSTGEVIQNANFSIYPTIVQNGSVVYLEYDRQLSDLTIVSTDGRIQAYEWVDNHSIRLIKAPAGIYIVAARFGDVVMREKIIKRE